MKNILNGPEIAFKKLDSSIVNSQEFNLFSNEELSNNLNSNKTKNNFNYFKWINNIYYSNNLQTLYNTYVFRR